MSGLLRDIAVLDALLRLAQCSPGPTFHAGMPQAGRAAVSSASLYVCTWLSSCGGGFTCYPKSTRALLRRSAGLYKNEDVICSLRRILDFR